MKILIAEDKAVNRLILKNMLSDMDYEIIEACNGNEAWQILQQDDSPELIVMDWGMPGLSGIEVCRLVRERYVDDSCYKYVIMLSGKSDKQDITVGFIAGVDDYITKPFDLDDIRMRVRAGERIVAMQKKLRHLATWDYLTGALNRQSVLSRLEAEFDRCSRDERYIVVAMFDIDYFKKVNDTYGHIVGDSVLNAVVKIVQQSLRAYDLVGRFGGEEFLVVLPGTDTVLGAGIIERIRHTVSVTPLIIEGITVNVTISVGGVAFKGGHSIDTVLKSVDDALYEAKRQGRNCVVFKDC